MDFIPRTMRKFFAAGESILNPSRPNHNHNLNPSKPITIRSRIMITNWNKIPRRKRINFQNALGEWIQIKLDKEK
jgi:hypothetical protein